VIHLPRPSKSFAADRVSASAADGGSLCSQRSSLERVNRRAASGRGITVTFPAIPLRFKEKSLKSKF
jgi:hypothetical protein